MMLMILEGILMCLRAVFRLLMLTESKAFDISNDAIQISLLRLFAVSIVDIVIEIGSIVLWFLRLAKLKLDNILCVLIVEDSLLFKILVNIFLLVSSREIGRVSVSSCNQMSFFGRRVIA